MDTITKNYEADNRTGLNHEGRQPNYPVERLTATSIIGDHVENLAGEHLGEIANVIVNTSMGKIEYAVIDVKDSISDSTKLYAVPFAALTLDSKLKVFLLNIDIPSLKVAPGFDRAQWPDSDHPYFKNVNAFYASLFA